MDKQLKTYFENVIDLEKNAYLQRETLAELNGRINRLGHRKNITRSKVTVYHEWFEKAFNVGVVAAIALAIIFGIKGLFKDFLSGAIGGILKGGLIGIAIGAIVGLICFGIEKTKASNKQANWDADYNREVAADNRRVVEENKQKANLMELRDQLEQQHRKTTEALQKYYNIGLIYPKYSKPLTKR